MGSHNWKWPALALAALIVPATAAHAQDVIPLEIGEDWRHPHTGIVVPAELGGITRTRGVSYSEDDLNIGIVFDDAPRGEFLTVYVYRNVGGGVPVWFAQSRMALEMRPEFAEATLPAGIEPVALPGRNTPSGLMASYGLPKESGRSSTGVALFEVGGFLVKLRATSERRGAAALADTMRAALAELTWPEQAGRGVAPLPVIDCPQPLAFDGTSKDLPRDFSAALGAGLVGMIAQGKADGSEDSEAIGEARRQIQWCLEGSVGSTQRVYRADASADGFLIAIGDSGTSVTAGRSSGLGALLSSADDEKLARYEVVLHLEDVNVTFPAQDRLPSPERVVEIVNSGRIVMSVPTWGDDRGIEVRLPADAD